MASGTIFTQSILNQMVSRIPSIAELRRSPIPIPYLESEGNRGKSMNRFLMVIMASGIARGRVRTTTTVVESPNLAAML